MHSFESALSLSLVAAADAVLVQEVVGDVVAQGQRRHLDDVDLDVHVLEVLDGPLDHVALHGEQADFRLHGEAVGDQRPGRSSGSPRRPLRAGNGICCLASNLTMSAIFFSSTGGSLTKRARPLWPGHADGDHVALDAVAREELLQRLAGQLIGVGVGLAEDLRVLDVIEGGGRHRRRRHVRGEWP